MFQMEQRSQKNREHVSFSAWRRLRCSSKSVSSCQTVLQPKPLLFWSPCVCHQISAASPECSLPRLQLPPLHRLPAASEHPLQDSGAGPAVNRRAPTVYTFEPRSKLTFIRDETLNDRPPCDSDSPVITHLSQSSSLLW